MTKTTMDGLTKRDASVVTAATAYLADLGFTVLDVFMVEADIGGSQMDALVLTPDGEADQVSVLLQDGVGSHAAVA